MPKSRRASLFDHDGDSGNSWNNSNWLSTAIISTGMLFLLVVLAGCGHVPAPVHQQSNLKDISARADDIAYLKRMGATFLGMDANGIPFGVDSGAGFDDRAMSKLSRLELEYLNLLDAPVTDAGVKCLKNQVTLQRLALFEASSVTDGCMATIGGLKHLRHLDLSGTKITDASTAFIASLNQLEFLIIERTKITEMGVRKLRQELPNVQILY